MPRRPNTKKKEQIKEIAITNISELFEEAKKICKEDKNLANKYVKIALRTRDKAKVSLTREQKKLFCKKCFSFLIPGENCSVRVKNKFLIYHCKDCGNIRKFGVR